jgi:hypothetical protein
VNRSDLKKIEGLSDAAIDAIMALHGQDTEAQKKTVSTLETERDQIKAQLETASGQITEANRQIKEFEGMDVAGVKKAAADWQAKAEKAQADAAAQLQALRFDHALDGALTGAKAKNAKAVKALLDSGALKFNEADGSIIGLKEQLEKVQSEAAYLFEGAVDDPHIVDHTTTTSTVSNPFLAAVRKGAQLPEK